MKQVSRQNGESLVYVVRIYTYRSLSVHAFACAHSFFAADNDTNELVNDRMSTRRLAINNEVVMGPQIQSQHLHKSTCRNFRNAIENSRLLIPILFLFLGVQCPAGMVYDECGSSCPRTCESLVMPETNCDERCIDGCTCANGMVLRYDNVCVPEERCPCMRGNVPYPEGYVLQENCLEW